MELIRHDDTGVIFRSEDPADLAAAVLALKDDPARMQRIRQAASTFIKEEREWSTIVRRYVDIYDGLLSEKGSKVPQSVPGQTMDRQCASGLMAVAGATYPEEARALREAMPTALFLVPGYGAQGASAADAVAGFVAGQQGLEGGVVSSSRAVTYPPQAQAATTLTAWRAAITEAMAAAAAELRAVCVR